MGTNIQLDAHCALMIDDAHAAGHSLRCMNDTLLQLNAIFYAARSNVSGGQVSFGARGSSA